MCRRDEDPMTFPDGLRPNKKPTLRKARITPSDIARPARLTTQLETLQNVVISKTNQLL